MPPSLVNTRKKEKNRHTGTQNDETTQRRVRIPADHDKLARNIQKAVKKKKQSYELLDFNSAFNGKYAKLRHPDLSLWVAMMKAFSKILRSYLKNIQDEEVEDITISRDANPENRALIMHFGRFILVAPQERPKYTHERLKFKDRFCEGVNRYFYAAMVEKIYKKITKRIEAESESAPTEKNEGIAGMKPAALI